MIPVDAHEAVLSLTVNGGPRAVPAGTMLAGLLDALGLDARMVVVERNGVILRDRDRFGAVPLEAGDVLELVHFVGGG
jgi:thiamine biosynthesis protein ThiS